VRVRSLNWRRLMEKHRFRLSLLVSFLIHFFAIAFFSSEIGRASVKTETKPLEVTYQIEKIEKGREAFSKDSQIDKKSLEGQSSPTESFKKKDLLAVQGKVDDRLRMRVPFETPQRLDKSPIDFEREQSREIVIPSLTVEKMANPKYARYKDNIRQKIKEKAYQYIQNPAFQSGEVYLTFILLANGTLKQFKVIDEKTRANEYLRAISLKSIEESNPFPPFPADLNYPELTFSVPISFRIKQ